MFSISRADSDRRVGPLALLGVLLVPLLIAGGFLYSSWNSSHRLDRVEAAIVNLDAPVTIKGQIVPLGRQLAGGLVTGGRDDTVTDQNYDWVLSDQADAAAGLRAGTYAAVVTIPKNFSAAATSYSHTAADARQATIDVQTSANASIVDPGLSRAIVAAAVAALNTQLTTTYLDNVYVGFNGLAQQFSTVADAAGKLSDGADQLSSGVDRTDAGAAKLADGMQQLSTGGTTLATNVDTYADGVGQAADGLDRLAAGTEALPGQVRQLADGAGALSTGVTKLSGGADRLADGARRLDAGVPRLAAGAEQLASGADGLADQAPALVDGAAGIAAGTAGVSTGLRTYQRALTGGAVPCPAEFDEAQCQGFRAGLGAAAQGLGSAQGGLIAGAAEVSQGSAAYASGLKGDGTARNPGLVAGTRGLATGAQGLSDGVNGTARQPGLAAGVAGLSSGATQLATGTDRLAGGARQLATGTARLADGLPQVSSGVGQAAAGVQKLASGGRQLATGVRTYTGGVTASADGARQLSTGIGQLASGASGLAKGTDQLADGLAKGADAVPTYSNSDRDRLSTAVASPVQAPEASPSGAFSDVSAIAYLLAIALWVGALTSFLVFGTGVRRAWASTRPSASLMLRALAPAAVIGAVQALVLGGVVAALLELSVPRTAGLLGFAVFAAVTFAALNYALVALFGGVGRFVSVLLVVASAAGMLLSAVPAFFITLRPVLPLTPAMAGLKAVAGDGSGVGTSVAGLLGWLVVALVAGALAVVRRRQLSVDQVPAAVHA